MIHLTIQTVQTSPSGRIRSTGLQTALCQTVDDAQRIVQSLHWFHGTDTTITATMTDGAGEVIDRTDTTGWGERNRRPACRMVGQ